MSAIVSVVIPTYQREGLTLRAVNSVTTSSPDQVEVVVVDDAGQQPFDFPQRFNTATVPVRVHRLKQNSGPGVARKEGVLQATGKIVAFLDSDDEFSDFWVDELLKLDAAGQFDRAGGVMIVGGVGNPQVAPRWVLAVLRLIPGRPRLLVSRLITVFFNPFYTPSVAITRGSVKFHDNLRFCEDYYMVAVSLFNVEALILPRVIACKLGREPNSAGGASEHRELMRSGEIAARRAILETRDLPAWFTALAPLGTLYQKGRERLKAALHG